MRSATISLSCNQGMSDLPETITNNASANEFRKIFKSCTNDVRSMKFSLSNFYQFHRIVKYILGFFKDCIL